VTYVSGLDQLAMAEEPVMSELLSGANREKYRENQAIQGNC
jgi:hypothetical protein